LESWTKNYKNGKMEKKIKNKNNMFEIGGAQLNVVQDSAKSYGM